MILYDNGRACNGDSITDGWESATDAQANGRSSIESNYMYIGYVNEIHGYTGSAVKTKKQFNFVNYNKL